MFKKVAATVVLITMAIVPAIAQDIDFNIMGTGARARGMGGAFIGVADDATAVGWNPAGLAQLDKPEASMVGLFNMKKFSYEFTVDAYPELNDSWDETVSHIAPAFASFVLPTKMADKNLVFAIAYQRMIDMGYVRKGDDEYWDGVSWVPYDYEEKTTGGLDAISPALALQVTPQVMVGMAGNILINGYKTEYNETYPDYPSDSYEYTMESDLSGFNMNAGFLGTFNKVNVGAMFRLPFTMTEKYSEEENWSYGGVTGNYSEPSPDIEITMPFMFGFGLALKPTDKLTFAADFERRPYSSSEVTVEGETDEIGYKDCNQFRVGLEYIMSGTNSVFPVRLGFRTDPRVYTGMYGDGTDTTQVVGKVFTGGFGLVMGKLMLDLAYEFTMANHVDAEFGGFAIKSDEASHNIMASAIIHF